MILKISKYSIHILLTFNRREVSNQDGLDLANENNLLYIETSALNSTGVQDAFEQIAMKVLKKLKKGIIDPSIEVSF